MLRRPRGWMRFFLADCLFLPPTGRSLPPFPPLRDLHSAGILKTAYGCADYLNYSAFHSFHHGIQNGGYAFDGIKKNGYNFESPLKGKPFFSRASLLDNKNINCIFFRFYARIRPSVLKISKSFSEFVDSEDLKQKIITDRPSSVSGSYFDVLTKGLDVEVRTSKEKGRGIYSKKTFEVGEIIHNALPLVSHPLPSQIHNVCYLCLRKLQKKETENENVKENENENERDGKNILRKIETNDDDYGDDYDDGGGDDTTKKDVTKKKDKKKKKEKNKVFEISEKQDGKFFIKINDIDARWERYKQKQKQEYDEYMKFDGTMFCSKACEKKAEDEFYELEKAVNWQAFNDYCKGLKFPHVIKRFAAMVFCNAASANAFKPFSFAKLPGSYPPEWNEQEKILKSSMEKIIAIQALHYITADWYSAIMSRLHLNSFQVRLHSKKDDFKCDKNIFNKNNDDGALENNNCDINSNQNNAIDKKIRKAINKPVQFLEKNFFEPKGKDFPRAEVKLLLENKQKLHFNNSIDTDKMNGNNYGDIRSNNDNNNTCNNNATTAVDKNVVGTAMYLLPSFYNHSCVLFDIWYLHMGTIDPNVHIFWGEDVTAQIYAIKRIVKGDELCISYIDASMSYKERQYYLRQFYGFECQCGRCLNKK